MKKVTIITVNYNNCHGLERTINSVALQSYSDMEYIIIDGGSTDKSVDIIKRNESVVSFWVSEKDNGIYNAMNKGIGFAHGEYLLFLNSGDYFVDRNVLSRIFDNSLNVNEDLLIGRQRFIDIKNNKKGISPKLYVDEINMEFFLSSTLPHQSTFIKRSLFDMCGVYDETYRVCADWVFWVKSVIENNCAMRILPFAVSYMEDGGVSSDMDKCHKDMSRFLETCLHNGTLTWKDIFRCAMKARSQDFSNRFYLTRLCNKLFIKIGKRL